MDEALEDILKVIFDQVRGKPPNYLFNAIFHDGFVTHACVPKRLPAGSFASRSPEEATCSESKHSGVQARRMKMFQGYGYGYEARFV